MNDNSAKTIQIKLADRLISELSAVEEFTGISRMELLKVALRIGLTGIQKRFGVPLSDAPAKASTAPALLTR